MNLYTAKLLVPIRRRHDMPQERLPWFPDWVYEKRKPY